MAVKGSEIIQIGKIELPNCLFIPELNYKLLSISHLTKFLPYSVLITSSLCHVQELQWYWARGSLLSSARTLSRKCNTCLPIIRASALGAASPARSPSLSYLKLLFPSLTKNISSFDCESCVLSKSHKHSYLSSTSHNKEPFALIHTDVWGPLLLITPLAMLILWLLLIIVLVYAGCIFWNKNRKF